MPLLMEGVPPEVEAHAPAAERERVDAIMQCVLPLSRRLAGIRNDSNTVIGPMPFERIAVPTLIITARDDLFGTLPAAEYMAERIPRAKLIALDSGGHLFVGRQQEVNGAIADFLQVAATDTRRAAVPAAGLTRAFDSDQTAGRRYPVACMRPGRCGLESTPRANRLKAWTVD